MMFHPFLKSSILILALIAISAFGSEIVSRKTSRSVALLFNDRGSRLPSPKREVTAPRLSVPCSAALTVNDNGDDNDAAPGNGFCATVGAVCTLRAAIQEANAQTTCGPIDINFSGVISPLSLTSALPEMDHNLNLIGPGADQLVIQRTKLSGTPGFRVFSIAAGRTVVLLGMTVSNGKILSGGGGGILNSGTLVVSECVISNNSSRDGGGIFSSSTGPGSIGSLVINKSTISGNSSTGSGGGIVSNEGPSSIFNISNSTISGNTATTVGGGLAIGLGSPTTGWIVNSTISGNSAGADGGGLVLSSPTSLALNLVNSTVTNNRANSQGSNSSIGGGVTTLSSAVLKLRNTIVARNFRGNASTPDDIGSTVDPASSFNLVGVGGTGGLSNGANNNQVAVSNPGLSALANNGGATMTHALSLDSTAVDAGSNALALDQNGPVLTDQRGPGFDRIVNGTVDIGAFEVQAPPAPSDQIVISQVYAGGGTPGATFQNGYLELFNRGRHAITLNGWLHQFGLSETAAISNAYAFGGSNPISIQPGQYFLIQLNSGGSAGASVPGPDRTIDQPSISSTGKIAITKFGTPFFGGISCPLPNTGITDFLGFGANNNCFEGIGPAPSLNNTTALIRKGGGCTDTDNNTSDFVVGQANPHNSSSAFNLCPNSVDQPDVFVRQQYLDFLNRQPDASGRAFWVANITNCGSDLDCIAVKRVDTSAAFYLSIEFQKTGSLVYNMYKTAFGNLAGKPVAVDRANFISDTRRIQSFPNQIIVGQGDWLNQLEANRSAFALAFVQRAAFQSAHASQDAATYVNSLFAAAGVTPTSAESAGAINAFNNAGEGDAGRASALRSVAESNSVTSKLFNEAFVLMQYFSYLQRNPYDPPEPTLDYQGYNFWLNKLNSFQGNYVNAEMVKAFITSAEYRQRFGQ